MLVGLGGAPSAGKKTVASILISQHGFKGLALRCDPKNIDKAHPAVAAITGVEANSSSNVAHLVLEQDWTCFGSASELTEWTTSRYDQDMVFLLDDLGPKDASLLFRRPFFIMVTVEAPISVRWARYQKTHKYKNSPSIEQFLELNDIFQAIEREKMAQMTIYNENSSLADLQAAVTKALARAPTKLRPSWNEYFMQLAILASKRCNCMKRRVGCVIVRDKRVLSTGYNGTPRGAVNCNEGGCKRCNEGQSKMAQGLDTCLCLHAEENALLEAGRERIGAGAILYCTTFPCLTCSVKIAQVGIAKVIYSEKYGTDEAATKFLAHAGINVEQYTPGHSYPERITAGTP